MSDHISQIKSAARRIQIPSCVYSHTLEISVLALTDAKDWNYCANHSVKVGFPISVEEWFARVYRIHDLLLKLEIIEYEDFYYAIVVMEAMIGDRSQSNDMPVLGEILRNEKELCAPMTVDSDMKLIPTNELMNVQSVQSSLFVWLFTVYMKNPDYGDYIWGHVGKLAMNLGFSQEQASLIRACQREAPNHSWDVDLWFRVGLLHPDPIACLSTLKGTYGWESELTHLMD